MEDDSYIDTLHLSLSFFMLSQLYMNNNEVINHDSFEMAKNGPSKQRKARILADHHGDPSIIIIHARILPQSADTFAFGLLFIHRAITTHTQVERFGWSYINHRL